MANEPIENHPIAAYFIDSVWTIDPNFDFGTDPDPLDDSDDDLLSGLSYSTTPIKLVDTSTFERWLQSALRALVAPKLRVDGVLGSTTRLALRKFQLHVHKWLPKAAALEPDGIPGPGTVEALEQTTGTKAPTAHPSPVAPPPSSTERIVMTTRYDKNETQYVARLGDDEIRFSMWSKVRKAANGTEFHDPYNVSKYEGAKVDLLTDKDLVSLGFSTSGARIFRANALKESAGRFGATNTYDNQIVSWGIAQFAGHAGTLARLLAELKETPETTPHFSRFFVQNGIDVDYGPYPYDDMAKGIETTRSSGWHIVVTDAKTSHRGDRGWKFLRTQPQMLAAFFLAGNQVEIQRGQAKFWRENFLDKALRTKIGDTGYRFADYITSEYGVGLGARLFNWMPAWLSKWFCDIAQTLGVRYGGLDFLNPNTWNQNPAYEEDFWVLMKDRRRREKAGSWDTYGEDLLRVRGSYSMSQTGTSP